MSARITNTDQFSALREKQALSARGLAEVLDVSVSKSKQMIYRGEIPSILIGGNRRVLTDDVIHYLERSRKLQAQN
jgi:excisionase family DNA binding protein